MHAVTARSQGRMKRESMALHAAGRRDRGPFAGEDGDFEGDRRGFGEVKWEVVP